MSRRQRRGSEDTNVSFLDIICCGFGAIILLMVIVRPTPPIVLEESLIQDDGAVRKLQERLFEIRGQINYLETELNAKQQQLDSETKRVAILRTELDQLNLRKASVDETSTEEPTSVADLQIALQTLTREMRRLLKSAKVDEQFIAGVPVDSEYIIFIIDTSGSMRQFAWNSLQRQVFDVLRVHPRVKGIQIMTSDGRYMFPGSRNRWMTDSASRRREIREKLPTWLDTSSSSPVGGINKAIETHYDKDKRISLYVFGDDYQGRSVRRVIKAVERINKKRVNGDTLVRIHAIGFPVELLGGPGSMQRFGNLLRELAENNNGTFIGLEYAN